MSCPSSSPGFPPDVLWLQFHGDGDPCDDSPVIDSDVTWCRDRISDADEMYIRAAHIMPLLERVSCNTATPAEVWDWIKMLNAKSDQVEAAKMSAEDIKKMVRRYQERMDCMRNLDVALYAQWSANRDTPLDYPEWIIQQDNPGMSIPGLECGHLWAGWTSQERRTLFVANDWQPESITMN